MSENQGFEPYLDWSSLTQEMADDLHQLISAYKAAQKKFEEHNTTENAADLMRLQLELTATSAAIQQDLITIPVLVHLAGPKTEGTDSEGHEEIVQRCTRCGSLLQRWCEALVSMTPAGPRSVEQDEMPWWDPGDVVAKASGDNGHAMYEITEGRALEKHEKECLDLTGLSSEG